MLEQSSARTIKIEGKHIKWLATGAVTEYFHCIGKTVENGPEFYNYVMDTVSRITRYLGSNGREGADGTASDFQCVVCTDARRAFGVRDGDSVDICW